MSLSASIKDLLSAPHDAIEQVDYTARLAKGSLTPSQYARSLEELRWVHEALEEALRTCDVAASLYEPTSMARVDAITRDLEVLGVDEPVPPCSATARLIEQIQFWARSESPALLGALYVVEGSRMGSMFLARSVARILGVEVGLGRGLDYHAEGIEGRPQAWKAFKETLDAIGWTPDDAQAIRDGASRTMSGLHEIYAQLSMELTPGLQPVAASAAAGWG